MIHVFSSNGHNHAKEKLTWLFNQCNIFYPHVKFEQTTSTTKIPFLDVQVINDNGKISMDLYSKPTDTHQYLNWTSYHPRHIKTSIPYSLALRLRRICSNNQFFEKRACELQNVLLDCGYKNKLIKECIMKARRTAREEVLKTKPTSSTDHVPLVVTYNPALTNLHSILKDHHQILQTSSKCQATFKQPPLVAYPRGCNLSQMLTNKRLPPSDSSDPLYFTINNDTPNSLETTCKICDHSFHTNRNLKIHFSHKHKHQTQAQCSSHGFWPCRADSRCTCCKTYGKFTRTVTSITTGETLILAGHTTCQTSNVIYLIECNKCNDQYIGETKNPIHRCINQH